jgi:putative DNA primase/helicase
MGLEEFTDDSWFKDGSLQSEALADHVLDNLHIVTMEDNEEMYVYENGIYRDIGELRVKQFLTEELGNNYSRHNRAEVMEVVRNKTAKPREDFGEPNEWVCLGNCQYNIETGKKRPHSPEQEYLYKIDTEYNEQAACPKFDRFLVQHVPIGRLKYVWSMFAHALHRGYPTQSAFLLWGDTATGKSTTLRVLENMIGQENVAAQSVRQLKNGNHAMANLYGKQSNIIAEAPSPQEMKQQEFKALTGGDLLHANPKHQDPFEFYNSATMIFATNDMLELGDLDDLEAEFLRRWEQINYKNTVPESEREDNYYRRFTENKDEMEGILRRTLEAAYRMKQRGGLSFEWDELWNYYEDLEEREKDTEDDEDTEVEIESGWFEG